jgi:hypothetical protein
MKWLIVERRVWEVEAKDRKEALKVFKESEAPPPAETTLVSEDWWTEERCDQLAELVRQSIEGRVGVCNDAYDHDEFAKWIKKADKVVKKVLGVGLGVRELDGDNASHDGRWRISPDGVDAQVGAYLLEGYDNNDNSIEVQITVKEDVALKILVMGGF